MVGFAIIGDRHQALDASAESQHAVAPGDELPKDDLVFFRLDLDPAVGPVGVSRQKARGLEKFQAECQLICLTHHLLKIWRRQDRLAGG